MTDQTVVDETVEENTETTETTERTSQVITEPDKPVDWRAAIADEKLRERANRFNSLDDVLKNNVDLLSERDRLRNTGIFRPGDEASDEDVAAYRKAMGIPDSPEGYEFPQGDDITDEQKASQEAWSKHFHELGISGTQAKSLIEAVQRGAEEAQQRQIEADRELAEQTTAALKKEWGADFDHNKELANRAAEKMFGEDFEDIRSLETKDGRFILDDARLLRALARYGREMAADNPSDMMDDTQRETVQDEIDNLRTQIHEAVARGDSRKANSLSERQRELIAKMQGSRPVVGAEGRAA